MSDGFPNNPSDLDRASGNEKKYVFNSEDDTWKNFGGVADYPLVSSENDGLVYPDLYDRLQQIRESKDLNNLKLTEAKSYFYNFVSTDKLVKFNVENNNFRIELDKGAITRKIATMPCVGPRGPRGPQGKAGRDGVPAPNEKFRPVYQDGSFELIVQTPLDEQPISLRGYKLNSEEFEALLYFSGVVVDEDNGIKTNSDGTKEIEIVGDHKSGKVTVKGVLSDPSLRFKVRQRGPDGVDGKDGVNYLEVVTEDVGANGSYTEVVGSLRYNSALNSLIFKRTAINDLLSNVVNLVTTPFLPTEDYWASVEITSNARKAVEYHQYQPIAEAPALNLPSYVPLSGCYNQRRYAMGYLEAPENTPFTFVTDLFPEYKSCKDPFWFCGNSGSNGGVCDGLINVDPNRPNAPFETSSTSSTSETSETSEESASSSESLSESLSESESLSTSESESLSTSESESLSTESNSTNSSQSESTLSESSQSNEGSSDSSVSDSSVSESSDSSQSESSVSESSDSSQSDSSVSDSSDSSVSDSSDSSVSDSSDSSVSDSSDSSVSSVSSESSSSVSSESFSSESLSSNSSDSLSSVSSESLSSVSTESLSTESLSSATSPDESDSSASSPDESDSSASSPDDDSSASSGECLAEAILSGECSGGYEYGEYKVIGGIPTIFFDIGYGFELQYYSGTWNVTGVPNSHPANAIYITYQSSYDLFCSGSGTVVVIEFTDYAYYCTGTIVV